MCFGLLAMPYDMEVLTYPDVVVYPSGVKEFEPVTSNELSISHKVSNTALTSKTQEPCNEFHTLFSVGVASLVHHLEDNRKGHSFVDDSESEDVDVRITELPISSVQRQGIRSFYRYEL